MDTSFATHTRAAVDVSDMLTWTPRTITAKNKCAHRIGRERNVSSVTAWVRRIKLHARPDVLGAKGEVADRHAL